MDIQGASAATTQSITQGRTGALESAAGERQAVEDSAIERKEVERSSTGPGVGERVDLEA